MLQKARTSYYCTKTEKLHIQINLTIYKNKQLLKDCEYKRIKFIKKHQLLQNKTTSNASILYTLVTATLIMNGIYPSGTGAFNAFCQVTEACTKNSEIPECRALKQLGYIEKHKRSVVKFVLKIYWTNCISKLTNVTPK